MHEAQLDTSVELLRTLLREQHPQWADLPIAEVDSTGTVHALARAVARAPTLSNVPAGARAAAPWRSASASVGADRLDR